MILPNKQNFYLFKFWITLVFSGARVVLVTVSESKAFNLQKGIYTFPEKFVYEMSEMCRQSRADYVETWFQLANKVEHMNLTVQEANILKCIGLFSSGKKKFKVIFFELIYVWYSLQGASFDFGRATTDTVVRVVLVPPYLKFIYTKQKQTWRNFFLWSLSLLSMHINLDSLLLSLSPQYKWILMEVLVWQGYKE